MLMSEIRIQTASFIATIRFSATARRICWVECSVTNVSEIRSGAMYETPFHFCHIIIGRVMLHFHITLEAVPLSLKSANAEIGMGVDLQTLEDLKAH